MQRSAGVNHRSNYQWPPNLVGRIPEQSEHIAGVKGHARVIWDQPVVKFLMKLKIPIGIELLMSTGALVAIKHFQTAHVRSGYESLINHGR